ncbi:MAG: hypothetical protein ABS35_07395 [Kaistia sp. SCN 65-12]|nr:MAG: hypothetical protein ABS35_07395 [Kaistia sp. SCN 65-12]
MTFGYECRPSFWRTMRANSHLVIAALGTASFLGVAGLALWLAMPSAERSAFADPQEMAAAEAAGEVPVAATAAVKPAKAHGGEAPRKTAAAEAGIPALKPTDMRWKDPDAAEARAVVSPQGDARQAVEGEATAAAKAQEEGGGSPLAAFAAANRAQVGDNSEAAGSSPDAAETAAIPTARPEAAAQPKERKPAQAGDAPAAGAGHIVRAVTMRSGPGKGAPAIGTIPARTAVRVVSCNQWCEVVYNSRRGFIYKSFLRRD